MLVLALTLPFTLPARAQDCELEVATIGLSGKPANNDSGGPSLSFDGRFVAYSSVATDLVAGDTVSVRALRLMRVAPR